MSAPRRSRGQAAVETALVMPLTLFMILGTVQLFMTYNARIMAQVAVARATRTGSLSHGDCTKMRHAALVELLPTFNATNSAARLADAFQRQESGKFDLVSDNGTPNNETIVWIRRERPTFAEIANNEEDIFDLPENNRILEVRMTFWFPLRVPFANWVLAHIALSKFQLENFDGPNPLMMNREETWTGNGSIDPAVGNEMRKRAQAGLYFLPIETTYAMRMMTPARRNRFASPMCPPYP